ncbi:hypothetical protein [Pseudarthrobacter sp. efr-133-R2A-89]|uniref:hypothetical protein n=1 Tax=Pseudarthrobacter sp. efr-133-R2A-89 TaxID=3040302 RepID=UPI0025556D42|nr:hypothetical protein [Pseudarthrobacter sp. efr-133-R2A-89]
MTATLLTRLRDWAIDTFTCESESEAAGAMADATRWGWLPALSGVSVGADHARSEHLGRVSGGN